MILQSSSHLQSSSQESETYQQIARAIAFMRQHHLAQPDLETIAQHVHLSKYHFQRQFTQWAGISPKRFSQYLTLEYAKSKIEDTPSLLDLSDAAGLSGPGRLHDLFVSLEAMSPGEFKAGGQGLNIRYGIHQTPFGPCLIATTQRGICALRFANKKADEADEADEASNGIANEAANENRLVQQLYAEWPKADIEQESTTTKELYDRIFPPTNTVHESPPQSAPLVLHIKGTNFQFQVWRALLSIPPGSLLTYQHLASHMGRPTAARAIGNAIGRNPVGYLIPCHRVIRGSGELGGYRWGENRKAAIIGWEASHLTLKNKLKQTEANP